MASKPERNDQNGVSVRPPASLRAHKDVALVPRMDVKELSAFRDDVDRRGVLVPLEVNPAGVVLDGHQRLQVALELGLEEVPVRIVAPTDEREHMLLATLRRRNLTPSQQATIAFELGVYQLARDEAQARRLANLNNQPEVATLPPRGERTRELAARLVAVSPRTMQDVATVHNADLELFEAIRSNRIPAHRAARLVRRRQRDQSLPPAPPLPTGLFEVIYADPPWQLGNPDGQYAPENHYPCMALEELKALRVPTAKNAVLFLWAVNGLLPEALELMASWGFDYVAQIVWVKPSIGLGNWTRNRHELLLWGKRGNHPNPDPEDRPDSVVEAPRGRHSEKPTRLHELIERAYPSATKLELFARGTPRKGWTAWGNEVTP